MSKLIAPQHPRRLPCWCRAVYSWGGENKGDLGFVEGDLIECLNVGDGAWWCGRLRRDMRTRGMFPSNFVEVLDQSYQPTNRATSPLPDRTPSPKPAPTGLTRSKPFRKPFQAYAAPDTAAQKRAELRQQESVTVPRTPSPAPRGRQTRARSPQPYTRRGPPSPPPANPFAAYNDASIYTIPGEDHSNLLSVEGDQGSPPPPLPPPHRSDFRAQTSTGFREHHEGYSDAFQRTHSLSPDQRTPERAAHTPSPLTNAMNDIINTMEDMSSFGPEPFITDSEYLAGPELTVIARQTSLSQQEERSSADAWDEIATNGGYIYPSTTGEIATNRGGYIYPSGEGQAGYQDSPSAQLDMPLRPTTSIGIDHEHGSARIRSSHKRSQTVISAEPPQLSNYVERMESRLGRIKRAVTPQLPDHHHFDDEDAPPIPPKTSFRPKSPFARPKSPWARPKSPWGRSNSPSGRPISPSGSPKSPFGSFKRPKSPFSRPKSPFFSRPKSPFSRSKSPDMPPPLPTHPRSKSSVGDYGPHRALKPKKSAYEASKALIGRTFTTKSSSTNASAGGQSTTTNGTTSTRTTERSLMSGKSAGAYSSTSAGSYARKQAEKYGRAQSAMGSRREEFDGGRPETPFTGVTYHSSHASELPPAESQAGWRGDAQDLTPKAKSKKSGFFKRMVESAKTGAASARSTISVGETRNSYGSNMTAVQSRSKTPSGMTAVAGGFGNTYGTQFANAKEAAREMGMGTSGIDWVVVRRDVNRANSLSKHERAERKERCLIDKFRAMDPVTALHEATAGDQDGDGNPVLEPFVLQDSSLTLVDKNARFVTSLPSVNSAIGLATGYVCRAYRTDVQRLRAIFTWCAEKIAWEDFFEGDVDTARVIQTRRGGTEELVFLVLEMCEAINIPCNVIRGYLKIPGENLEGRRPPPTHFWNSVLVDNAWRIMDCSLASPSHPKRGLYSEAPDTKAEPFYFLTRPSEICWTHVPDHDADQHLVPPVNPQILLALPCTCPPFFKNNLQMVDFDTSLTRIEDLEVMHIKFFVPADVECTAVTESFSLARDTDGDLYETDNIAKMPALSQASWVGGRKQYTVKAIPPHNSAGHGMLKVYAGPRGLITSPRYNPHPMAFALPVVHTGDKCDSYDFVIRYPTPQATRNDLYVIQPQCRRLVSGHTFVFAVRQHASSVPLTEEALSEVSGAPGWEGGRSPMPGLGSRDGNRSPIPYVRPTSAMSVNSTSASGTGSSSASAAAAAAVAMASSPGGQPDKPSKLAIQGPGGKILRLQKRDERLGSGNSESKADGRVYETTIKCGEKGVWRGLVLADRGARWCVFAEWTCV